MARPHPQPPRPPASDLASSLTSNPTDFDSGRVAAAFDPAAYFAAHTRTMEHGAAVLAARRAPRKGNSNRLPPVWTPHRAYLSEALDYVGERAARGGSGQGETVAEGGAGGGGVVSLVLGGRQEGRSRGYLDGEVLVCEIGAGVGVWEAWERTRRRFGSVVVMVGREWVAADGVIPWPEGIGERGYVVLDNFRVCELWEEMRGGPKGIVGMVKLQKAVLSEVSWWMMGKEGGEKVLDLSERRFLGDEWHESKRLRCPACNRAMPKMYRECWICVNSSCGQFWREGLTRDSEDGPLRGVPIPEKLRWDKTFLMSRTMFDSDMRPTWNLQPEITTALTPPWQPIQESNMCATGTIRMRSLWRGGACSACKTIVPAVEWCVWKCVNPRCHGPWRLSFDIGPMPLRAAVPRMFASWLGHPMLEPEWADELGGDVTRLYRPTYMVDSWNFNGGDWPIKMKVITPTAPLNQKAGGADSIWTNLLSETRSHPGGGPPNYRPAPPPQLVLNRSNQYPKLDKYFHKTFGVDFGFDCSEGDSHTKALPMARASASVSQARDILDAMCRDELAGFFLDTPNSVQVHGYMEGMSLGWHVGGEQDIGNTVSILSLGADAELLIRPRTDPEARPWTAGVLPDKEDLFRALTRVPLIHGSMVIIHGPFHDYFEQKVDCKGPLRFAITSRHVKQIEKDELLRGMSDHKLSQRFNGPWFIESDDEEDAQRQTVRTVGRGPRPIPSQPSLGRHAPHASSQAFFYPRQPPTGRQPPTTLKRPRPRDRSASPRPRQRRRATPSDLDGGEDDRDGGAYKTPGWTLAQKDQIYEWKKTHTYKQVAKLFEDKYGEGKVKHNQLRMVVHRVKLDRQKAAALRGEEYNEEDGAAATATATEDGGDHDQEQYQDEDHSSIAPSDSASAVVVAGNGYLDPSKWTPAELDLLVACRAQNPPMSYKDIAVKIRTDLRRARSDKACREQMTTLNRKRKGVKRARGGAVTVGNGNVNARGQGQGQVLQLAVPEGGGSVGVEREREATSPLARHPMNADEEEDDEEEDDEEEDGDVDMSEVGEEGGAVTPTPAPLQQQQAGGANVSRTRQGSAADRAQTQVESTPAGARGSRGSRGSRSSAAGSGGAGGRAGGTGAESMRVSGKLSSVAEETPPNHNDSGGTRIRTRSVARVEDDDGI